MVFTLHVCSAGKEMICPTSISLSVAEIGLPFSSIFTGFVLFIDNYLLTFKCEVRQIVE